MDTALDSKSSGVFPRGFETYWRLHFLRKKNNTWWSRGGRPTEVDLSLGPSLSLHGIKKAVKGTYTFDISKDSFATTTARQALF